MKMGTLFKEGMFDQSVHGALGSWATDVRSKHDNDEQSASHGMHKMMNNESSSTTVDLAEQEMVTMERSMNVLPCQVQPPSSSS